MEKPRLIRKLVGGYEVEVWDRPAANVEEEVWMLSQKYPGRRFVVSGGVSAEVRTCKRCGIDFTVKNWMDGPEVRRDYHYDPECAKIVREEYDCESKRTIAEQKRKNREWAAWDRSEEK